MNVISTTDGDMLQGVWDEEDCQINMCRVTQGEHFEHLGDYRHNYTSLQISFNYMFTHNIVIECGRLNFPKMAIPFHMLFCNVNLPFLHQVVESVSPLLLSGRTPWLLWSISYGGKDPLPVLLVALNWPGIFYILPLGSQLPCKKCSYPENTML